MIIYNVKVGLFNYDLNEETKEATIVAVASEHLQHRSSFIPGKVKYEGVDYVVKEIAYGAFSLFHKMQHVTIPSTIEKIGANTFMCCNGLEFVTIPESVTKLEKLTFNGCESLSHLTLPKTLKCIEESVFVDCYQLREIKFEGTVEQWKQITFNSEWDYYSGIETIKCVDGIVRV